MRAENYRLFNAEDMTMDEEAQLVALSSSIRLYYHLQHKQASWQELTLAKLAAAERWNMLSPYLRRQLR